MATGGPPPFFRTTQPSPPRSPWRRPPSPRPWRTLPHQIQVPLSSSSPSRSWDDGDDPLPAPVHLSSSRSDEHAPDLATLWTEEIDEPPVEDEKVPTVSTSWTCDETSSLEESKPESPMTVSDESWESRYHALQEKTNYHRADQEKSMKEIQKVLAEVTEQRDHVSMLHEQLQEKWQDDQKRIESLTQNQGAATDEENSETHETLVKRLAERTEALESAKMIITALESASGLQVFELRQKIRDKQAKIEKLEEEARTRQKTLDKLAIELRDNNAAAIPRRLWERLEENISEIRSAAVVLEATQDAASVSKLSDVLGDCVVALKEGAECFSSASSASNNSESVERELQQKNDRISSLEEELRKNKEQLRMVRSPDRWDSQVKSLQHEVHDLRNQHATNLAILARKERELAVLRDSLKVDDDVGYISDDAEDEDEEDTVPYAPPTLRATSYCASQVEALATLLAQGSSIVHANFPVDSGPCNVKEATERIQKLAAERDALSNELQTERQSLANAKMIISSLEKANKSMMENLRSRLLDSNTAIASLLENSVNSDRTTAQLRQDLENLKQQKDNEREKFEKELSRLRLGSWSTAFQGRPDDAMITETID